MPRRSLLSAAERASLLAVPSADDEQIRHFALSERDLSVIRQKRGAQNRLGFAVQLCAFRYPGILLPPGEPPPDALLHEVARQLRVPEEADAPMRRAYSLIPHVKITDLLLEVDRWTGFTRHFTHLKSGTPAGDRKLLLTAILADGINLGLSKMAESCPGTTYAKLSWLQAWHVREETYRSALAEVVNAQARHPFAALWGDGTTSSSDGQRFRAGGWGEAAEQVNARYGNDAGVLFYTHVSDQYAPFHTQVIHATVRDATYVLDGLLYHEADLKIEEHYTDTAGFTDHVFALMHLLGFRFAPRIRDLADRRLYLDGSTRR